MQNFIRRTLFIDLQHKILFDAYTFTGLPLIGAQVEHFGFRALQNFIKVLLLQTFWAASKCVFGAPLK